MKTAIIKFTTQVLGVICLISLNGMAFANGNPSLVTEDMLSESAESYMNDLFMDLKMGPYDGAPQLTCVSQVNVSISNLGYSVITPQMLLLGEDPPFTDFIVDIVGPLTDTVWCGQLEQLLQVKVTDTITGDNCWGWVKVEDYIDPVLDCSNDTVLCNTNLDSLDFESLLSATDNCTDSEDLIVNYSYDLVEYSCMEGYSGYMEIEWTVEDASGNVSECTQTVYFEKPPIDSVMFPADVTVFCPDANTDSEFTGVPTINGEPFDHFCDLVTFITDSESELCGEEAKIVRTFMVMDWCTNFMRIGTQDIFVEDTLAPVIDCPEDLSVGTDEHECEATFTIPGATASDDCTSDSTIQITIMIEGVFGTYEEGDVVVLDTGIYNLQYIATDICGNKDTCETALSVVDDEEPSLVCEVFDVFLNTDGLITVGIGPFVDFFSDNCGEADIDIRRVTDLCEIEGNAEFGNAVTFCCEDAGSVVMVEVQATDNSGNELSCMVGISVFDNMPPEAKCKNITVSLDENGDAVIDSNMVDNGSTDNCSIASYEVTPSVFDCGKLGTNDVTLTVTDESGNTSTCTAVVTIVDEADPIANCQDITVNLINGFAMITAAQIDNESSDNCGDSLTLSIDIDTFTCEDIGEITVILTVTDPDGNTDTCSATVTVQDVMMPVCVPKNITVFLDENGTVTITGADIDGGSTDACGDIVSMVADPNQFNCADTGMNIVVLTVTDNSGNTSTCEATVTVEDTIPPTAECQNITISLDSNGLATIEAGDVDGGSTDNCNTFPSLSIDIDSFDCLDTGMNIVVLTVTDDSGNTSTCEATVTVEDSLPPTAICMDITISLGSNGQAGIVAAEVDGGSMDNCDSDPSLSIDIDSFDCADIEAPVTVTLTVTDDSGNTSTCEATVTVEDSLPPTAVCMDITISLDSNGQAGIVAAEVDGGSMDNCDSDPSLAIDIDSFDCADIEAPVTVTLTVTDSSGNTSACEATVTVEDTIPPTAVCMDITISLDSNGLATIEAGDVDGGSTDNCDSDPSLSIDIELFGCADIGDNEVILTVEDGEGNNDTCTAIVTVENEDNITCSTMDITVYLDEMGDATITPEQVNNGSMVVCGIMGLSLSQSAFNCDDLGVDTIFLIVSNGLGNIDSCTAMVTIEDTIDPSAVCMDITISLDSSGLATIEAADVDGGSMDVCDSDPSLSIDIDSFDCADIEAPVTVTLTVTDNSGNTSTCEATVTVEDTLPPTAVCMDITILLDSIGQATIVAADVDGGSTDNCDTFPSLSIDIDSFDCDNTGDNEVILTVTDGQGNSDTCTAIVTVEDDGEPVAMCKNITVQLDGDGEATIMASNINDGSFDACGEIESLAIDTSMFDCDDIGENTVTLTVTDNSGNTDTCTAIVTIEDNIDPTAVCMDITISLDSNGQAGIVAAEVDGGSMDNCDSDPSLSIDIDSFDCADIEAPVTVTLTVTDSSGNTDTCHAIVTVMDTTAPLAVCQNITVNLENGLVVIEALDVDGGSSDVCSLEDLELSIDQDSFGCADIGENEVILTVSDQFENSSTCIAIVTVVSDTPTIVCPADIIAEPTDTTGFCDSAFVEIPVPMASDDDGIESIIHNSPFADLPGENASGTYPAGINFVTFIATDSCGISDSCTMSVTVNTDDTLAYECVKVIYILPESGSISFPADDFVNFIGGECNDGDSSEYFFSFTLDTAENADITINCDSIEGEEWQGKLTIYIFTADGDTTECLGGGEVLDENGVCDNFAPLMISGELNHECNADPNDSYVHLDYEASNEQTVVNEELYYEFSELPEGLDYVVAPYNNDYPLEELSALDLVTINRHLLNIQPFNSPYQYIGADVNHSETISALDMIEIRKILLGQSDEFTNNTSWRFVDRKYQFVDENNPLDEEFPEFIFLESLTEEVRDADFVAIKIGDVNYQVGEVEEEMEAEQSENSLWLRSSEKRTMIETPFTSWKTGTDIMVPLKFSNVGIEGFQLSIDLGSMSQYDLYLESDIPGFNESNWNIQDGLLSIVWVGVAIDNPTITLFSKAAGNGNVTEVAVSAAGLTDELYTSENLIERIDIDYTDGADELVLFQNRPNPFSEMTMIKFILPEKEPVHFSIMDASSKVIYELNQDYPAGENVIQIKKGDLKAKGVLYYSLDSKNGSQTKKMTTID